MLHVQKLEQMHFGMVPGNVMFGRFENVFFFFYIMIKKEEFLWVFIKKKKNVLFFTQIKVND